ncbi:manganese/zinc/iron transport system substrate-binding protein [Symbiobacterium terraclitae]|uniref:Manganese/zinc/iron transport system substrate-binding protein n=1 Tax=Symbiobacterium terraclitae TaxID=557451 RepID=A0ABS4JQ61_9FIRM|nr:zinc ABC transporter substrate-binding protein [Symbiobacterium terraclitae]MBP2017679.1 manganese/zinc/iron transport system substrate-binding protein [Symbiobacterium terraclitae]
MRQWARLVLAVWLCVAAGAAAGCGTSRAGEPADGRIRAVATTGMVADLVRNVGGGRVAVTALMGPGVDPHLFKASEGDMARLQQAQIVFYNGLHLEGRMGDILEKMARDKPTVAVAERIPEELLLMAEDGVPDPHVWFDVSLWMLAVDIVRDSLIELDPAGRSVYEQNAAVYREELAELDRYARAQLNTVPAGRRVLVTAHDAFGYFGRAYGIEVRGLQGISTATEYGLADLRQLVDLLVERQIKAVFIESSVPRSSVEALVEGAAARGHAVAIGGELFSDALGAEGTPEGTYAGMIRHNVDTIVAALR